MSNKLFVMKELFYLVGLEGLEPSRTALDECLLLAERGPPRKLGRRQSPVNSGRL